MRIAVVSSPRSGNTWIRSMLGDCLNVPQYAAHNYLEFPILPEDCIIQIHWYREPNFQKFLIDNGFKVIVISRHPFDILVSLAHFIQYEPLTSRWLEGNAEIPEKLSGKSPASAEFLEYALSWGAENLLSVTYQWWHDQNSIRLRYEDFIRDPVNEMTKLINIFDGRVGQLDKVIEENDLEKFRRTPNNHGWQGREGVWKDLVPDKFGDIIYQKYELLFKTLYYEEYRSNISRDDAINNWSVLRI